MTLNRTHWIVVGGLAGGLAALCFFGWQFLVHPLAADYDAQMDKKQQIEKDLQTARDTAAQFDKFKAQAENVRRDLDFYNSRTEQGLGTLEVLQMMELLANQLSLRDWACEASPGPTPAGMTIGVCKVKATFKTDFDHLGRFLNACLTQRRLIVPDSVAVSSIDDPTGNFYDTVAVELHLSLYGGKGKKP